MQLANGRDRLDQADWIQTALQLSQAGNLPWIRAERAPSVLPVNIQWAWSPSSRILLSPAEEWDRNFRSHHDMETHRDCDRSSEGGGDHRRYLLLLLCFPAPSLFAFGHRQLFCFAPQDFDVRGVIFRPITLSPYASSALCYTDWQACTASPVIRSGLSTTCVASVLEKKIKSILFYTVYCFTSPPPVKIITLISTWKDNSVTPRKSTNDPRGWSDMKTEGPFLRLPLKQTIQDRYSYQTHFADEDWRQFLQDLIGSQQGLQLRQSDSESSCS